MRGFYVNCLELGCEQRLFLQESRSFPESYPELPKQDTVESSVLQKHILELATMLDVQSLFWDESLEAY